VRSFCSLCLFDEDNFNNVDFCLNLRMGKFVCSTCYFGRKDNHKFNVEMCLLSLNVVIIFVGVSYRLTRCLFFK